MSLSLSVSGLRMALIQELEVHRAQTQRQLDVYEEKLALIGVDHHPALAIMTMGDISGRYRQEFMKRIDCVKRDLRITDLKLALAQMEQRWSEMDETQQTASQLPDEIETLRESILEELGSSSDSSDESQSRESRER